LDTTQLRAGFTGAREQARSSSTPGTGPRMFAAPLYRPVNKVLIILPGASHPRRRTSLRRVANAICGVTKWRSS